MAQKRVDLWAKTHWRLVGKYYTKRGVNFLILMQIAQFRNKVKLYLQLADIPQKKLAEAIHMHPTVLSNKLGGTFRNAPFTYNQIKQIVKLLTEWQAINTQTEAV